ncbi:GNAT family N-acetyltransferase [Paenarthrobacter sp. Z7-10]|uniref:GNAT family N-acetyltransferase n=1 Tax=Paenarthrobacter sp. Z7-10 TaxID=2787635 RepID=UPI0022A9053C|nr:GNAT family N-acetyltransferase [Paenarthrobacter sp. Z7-10]
MNEDILVRLIDAATTDAAANEVTPPLTDDGEWSAARITWLRDFHRARRGGLDGPEAEATWAILTGNEVVGSVRLKRTGSPRVLETGIWIRRSHRERRAGQEALAAVLREASSLGYDEVCAETGGSNTAAQALLRKLGFTPSAADGTDRVWASLVLTDIPGPAVSRFPQDGTEQPQ